jgi:4-hydroxy-tetrahydrodipicolinate synthase
MTPPPRPLRGIIPPVATPFTEQHEVDVPSLERLVAFLLAGGVHGLFALGSTSETAALTDRQRATVLETVIAAAAGRVPVLAGVFDTATAPAIAHAEVAARLGADALVLTAPFYLRPGQAEIADHFRLVRAAVDRPIIAYDIPSAGPAKPARATILALAQEGVIAGLKDSSGDEGNFRLLLAETRAIPGFAAFTGSELLVDQALLAGAAGAVPGLANVDPAGFVRIYDAVQAGDLARARVEQERLGRLFAIINAATPGHMGVSAAAFGGFKTALQLRGVIATNAMGRPLARYDGDEAARVGAILASVDLLP